MKYLFLSLFFLFIFDTSLAGSSALSGLTSESELLMSAINKGDVNTVERVLVGGKVDLNILEQHGFDYVLYSGHASTILPVLLKHSKLRSGYEALEKSIRNNDVRSFQLLLDAGISPSFKNNQPVQLAARYGSKAILDILLKTQGVDPTEHSNYAIRLASENGHLEVVRLLLSNDRVDPTAVSNLAIRLASKNGYLEVVKLLLSNDRVDPTAINNQAIRWASENGHLQVVKMLLSLEGIDPTARRNEAIRMASKNGHLEVVKLLLSIKRVDPTDLDNEAIRFASENGHLEVVKLLLSTERVDPTAVENEAIRLASYYGHLEVVKLLINDWRVNLTVDTIAMFEKAKLESLRHYVSNDFRKRHSDIVLFLLQDQMVGSILFLQNLQRLPPSQKGLTPTRFLRMVDTKRAQNHASYINSVLNFPQVTDLLSGILGIDRAAAERITTLTRLNEEMVQFLKSLDMNDRNPLTRKRLEFLWRYFGALREYSKDNSSLFNQLTVWKLQNMNAIPGPLELPSKKPRLGK